MFDKLFKKNKKKLQEIIEFNYDTQYILVSIVLNNASSSIKSYLELIIEELEDEDIAIFENGTLSIPHKNVYKLEKETMQVLGFPSLFDGTAQVDLQGLINQQNANFIVNLFDESGTKIIPYKIFGSVLQVTSKTYYLLPENIYKIFIEKSRATNGNDFDKYRFIELLQNDTTDKITFTGLADNDFVQSVTNIDLDIKEDENQNLILSPRISDLDSERAEQYKNVIDASEDSLLISEQKDNSIVRYALDDRKIKIAKAINKRSIVPKEKAGLFMANPMSHFDDLNEEIREEFEELVLSRGYRIIGIGKPYTGYFGSVKIDTPLSEVLKSDPSFEFSIDKEEVLQFIEENREDLPKIEYKLQDAIKKELDSTIVGDRKLLNFQLPTYLKMVSKEIKKLERDGEKKKKDDGLVLLIDPNDSDDIELEQHTNKRLENITTNNTALESNYNNFKFTPFEHQVVALNWMIDLYSNGYPGCLLADDMGLGKTFEVISFIDYLLRKKPDAKILIVAPTVLMDNWKNEFENSLNSMERYGIKIIRGKNRALDKLQMITKGEATRDSVFNDLEVVNFVTDYNIYITTYKTLQKYQFAWVVEDINIQCMVYDEAQNIKNPNTLQTQAAKAVSSNVPFNIIMTGTPIENELRDIWCLFDVFDPTFFGSWKSFKNEYVKSQEESATESRLRAKISSYMLRRMKNDVLDGLPVKYEPKLDVQNSAHYPAADVVFSDQEVKDYLEIVNSDKPALTKLMALRLFSLHPIMVGEDKTFHIEDLLEKNLLEEYSKTKKLLEILKDIKSKDEKAIIFVISKSMQLFLQYALKKPLGLDEISVINGDNNKSSSRKTKLENFQNKDGFNVIILSPLAAGVGLTINEANHVIHLERHWNPAKEDQASDRVYRIGQDKDVYIHHIISKFPENIDKKSFDQGLNQLIMNKKTLSTDTLIPTAAVSDKDLVDSIFGKSTSGRTLDDIDNMNDREFENFVKEAFKEKGYKSRLTEKYPSEFGADVIAIKGDEIIAIQCKHSKAGAKVDKQAILQLYAESKDHYKATKLIAATNSYFNDNAKKLAKVHGVEIVDRETVLSLGHMI